MNRWRDGVTMVERERRRRRRRKRGRGSEARKMAFRGIFGHCSQLSVLGPLPGWHLPVCIFFCSNPSSLFYQTHRHGQINMSPKHKHKLSQGDLDRLATDDPHVALCQSNTSLLFLDLSCVPKNHLFELTTV